MSLRTLTYGKIVVIVSIYLSFFHNLTFNEKLLLWGTVNNVDSIYIYSTFILHTLLYVLILSVISFNRFYKFLISCVILIGAVSGYFIDTYNVIIDEQMLLNTLETNVSEAFDLLSLNMLTHLLIFFLLPLYFLFKTTPLKVSIFSTLKHQTLYVITSFIAIIVILYSMSSFYMSFFREQKAITAYTNPLKPLIAISDFMRHNVFKTDYEHINLGLDAKIVEKSDKRKIVVMIVGETARGDHFSLNGYSKKTNPLLENQNVINFSKAESCATLTRLSLPCMFSVDTRDDFDPTNSFNKDNVLDILKRAGVYVYWIDNNSDSKGVANRVNYESILNKCNGECRDIKLIENLDNLIKQNHNQDMLFILHAMGSHGPAYYKRVPTEFEHFNPICKTNQFEACTSEEIVNAYDNTILYADFVINSTIEFLKKYSEQYQTKLLYVSDHGESLGENNIYLHGIPYRFAPSAQTHIPIIFWADKYPSDLFGKLQKKSQEEISHDNIFHTLLGLFDVETKLYDINLDILKKVKK